MALSGSLPTPEESRVKPHCIGAGDDVAMGEAIWGEEERAP